MGIKAHQTIVTVSTQSLRIPFKALFLLVPFIFACSFLVLESNLKTANQNGKIGGETYRIARSLVAGDGFASPFAQPTGPTAWNSPVFPLFIAVLMWMFDSNVEALTVARMFVDAYVLIGTGLLIAAMSPMKPPFRSPSIKGLLPNRAAIALVVALLLYLVSLLWNFQASFERPHQDTFVIMLAFDIIIVGLCWYRPLKNWRTAALWGLLGGLCALISPIVGFSWGALTAWTSVRERAWSRLVLTLLFAALAVAPWTIRNYLVFGRIIPLKSNLAFELYQSQCLEQNGLLTNFKMHPGGLKNQEGREYLRLGEIGFLDRKWEQFCQSVATDPLDFADRVATRFLGATLWYKPFQEQRQPWVIMLKRLTHPLPLLAFVFLLFTSIWKPLTWPQQTVLGLYAVYLLPYIVISYYERYAQPLLGIKVLLVVWAAERLLSVTVGWATNLTCSPVRIQRQGK
jgi:hypothetical protein